MLSRGGQTALQRALGQYKNMQKEAKFETSAPTAMSGIGMWSDQGQERINEALADQLTGEMSVQQYANLGTNFGRSASNPWEAFISTSTEDMQSKFDSMSAQGTHSRPAAKTFYGSY